MPHAPLTILNAPPMPGSTMLLALTGWMDGGLVSTGTVKHLMHGRSLVDVARIGPAGFYIDSFPGSMEVTALFRPHVVYADGLVTEFDMPENAFHADPASRMAFFVGKEPNLNWPGFADCIYLDPLTHRKIEEVGSANFFAITGDGKFVTPRSESVLPGVTRMSLMDLARERLNLEVVEGDVHIDQLDQFVEAGACGTAAVITPIGGIQYGEKLHVFHSLTRPSRPRTWSTPCGETRSTASAPRPLKTLLS